MLVAVASSTSQSLSSSTATAMSSTTSTNSSSSDATASTSASSSTSTAAASATSSRLRELEQQLMEHQNGYNYYHSQMCANAHRRGSCEYQTAATSVTLHLQAMSDYDYLIREERRRLASEQASISSVQKTS